MTDWRYVMNIVFSYINGLLLGFAIILVILDSIDYMNYQSRKYALWDWISCLVTLFLIVGLVVIAYFGTWKGIRILLWVYLVLAIITALIQIAVLVFAIYIAVTETLPRQSYQALPLRSYQAFDEYEISMKRIDSYQKKHHCCGLSGATNWLAWIAAIPSSCCPGYEEKRWKWKDDFACTERDGYLNGCLDIAVASGKPLVQLMYDDFVEDLTNINAFQNKYSCCGTYGPAYWGNTIPASCCSNHTNGNNISCTLEYAYTVGCQFGYKGTSTYTQTAVLKRWDFLTTLIILLIAAIIIDIVLLSLRPVERSGLSALREVRSKS